MNNKLILRTVPAVLVAIALAYSLSPALAKEPAAKQTQFFALRGRVQSVKRQSLQPRQADLFGFQHFYQALHEKQYDRH